jgi:sterol desaturase/sphingolipid hydroxylase (fatty acid hydroxylase superfamily)
MAIRFRLSTPHGRLQAPISHHDSHHKFMQFSKNAKNYGENWLLWDQLFGTMSRKEYVVPIFPCFVYSLTHLAAANALDPAVVNVIKK